VIDLIGLFVVVMLVLLARIADARWQVRRRWGQRNEPAAGCIDCKITFKTLEEFRRHCVERHGTQ